MKASSHVIYLMECFVELLFFSLAPRIPETLQNLVHYLMSLPNDFGSGGFRWRRRR